MAATRKRKPKPPVLKPGTPKNPGVPGTGGTGPNDPARPPGKGGNPRQPRPTPAPTPLPNTPSLNDPNKPPPSAPPGMFWFWDSKAGQWLLQQDSKKKNPETPEQMGQSEDGSKTQACDEVKGKAPDGFKWQGAFVTNADGSISDTCQLVKDDSQTEDPMAGSRESAKTIMRNIMASLGFNTTSGFTQGEIDTLFGKMDEWITQGYADYDRSGNSLLMLFRTDKSTAPIYQKRFPGMAALQSRGQAISEAEYVNLEKQYRQVLSSANLPTKYYDSFDDYGRFIAGDVSASEVQDRVTAAQSAMNPNVLRELQQYYGIDSGTAHAYLLGLTDEKGIMLDVQAAARNQKTLADINRNIQIGGAAEAAGFNMDLAASQALAGTAVGQTVDPFNMGTMANLQGTFDQARRQANRQGTLAAIDQQGYDQQEALQSAFGNDQAKLASEKRAARERARFGGSSGAGGTSLSVARNL